MLIYLLSYGYGAIGCGTMPIKHRTDGLPGKYFSSPEQAISLITELLQEGDFKTLALFYDLSGSGIMLAELESGDFFIQREKPPVAHPAGFWRYKHPFAPGFTFEYVVPTDEEGIFSVHMAITIDQGAGQEPQVGYSDFRMVKSAQGWQVLPTR
jgi:hypothetical protein